MAGCSTAQLRSSNADSDSDSDCEGLGPRHQIIHSGHFMVSSPHGDDKHRGSEPQRPGNLPAGTIDPTLTRLFECMSLAYSGNLVSPKWKNFKGLRLLWRDKIRLNNAIWRAWYLQYIEKRKTPVCGFVTPLTGSEGDDHRKPEAVVLEGNYWKRRIEAVMKEYNKWRIYYKKRLRKLHQDGNKSFNEQWSAPAWRCSQVYYGCPRLEDICGTEEDMLYDLDYYLTDISDTLFTTTHGMQNTYQSPDYDYAGNSDMIQPGLSTFQPTPDDFADITDFFSGPRTQQLPVYFQEQNCFSSYNEGIANQHHPVATCQRIPQPYSSFGSRSESCFTNAVISPSYASTTMSCVSPRAESKHLPHYPLPRNDFSTDTDTFPPEQSLTMPCISQNLPVQNSDILFPHVSCPKHNYSGSVTESSILGHTAPSHTDNYPLYSENSSLEAPHIFSIPKQCGSLANNSDRTPAVDITERPTSVSPSKISLKAKPDSSTNVPSCGLIGQNSTTGARSDSLCFTAIAAPAVQPLVPPTIQCNFSPSPPPPIFVSPVFSSQNSSISGSTAQPCSSLQPKTERLSPTSICGGESKDSLSVLCLQSSTSWGRTGCKKVESRRITHISAEQKRRCNIKIGFDTLHNLVTTLRGQHSNKLSKATTLQKTAEYVYKLQQERAQLQEEAQHLRCQIQELNDSINLCQQQLPASGVPMTQQRFQHMRQLFQNYVQSRTLQNWKFWLFSLIITPLFESFNRMVSTASLADLRQTSLEWLDQYCSLPTLRPSVLSSLCQLSTSTSILSDPTLLPEQALQAVTRQDNEDIFL
ncbi:carbohydrate-responsive element-binding protein isoform X2 [Xenopus laevis]|uniref:Carbohydrate-responsive element-binding protein isoform X2 n=1 Tax=Xenopus laevis TaxID=8355 RepID=A0A8J0UE24_XENLA|nr:carbohydrate-responsive element-binding protein isoform X2 [Xenopus laevis]